MTAASITESVAETIEILVIDDTPANVRLLMQILTEQGYQVRPATEGAWALEAARLAPPDLILLDIQMPNMDGYVLCEELKADSRTAHVPIIFLTVLDDLDDVVKGFELGAVDYITKPFNTGELIARIENQIQLRSLEKQLADQNHRLQELLTQYQLTEVALRESEAKFSTAFQRSPIPLSLSSPDGTYLDINQAFLQETGYGREEVVGHTAIQLKFWVSSADRNHMIQTVQAQGHIRNFETQLRTKAGDIRAIILSVELVYLDNQPYLLVAAKDVTELKTVQMSLAQRSQELTEALSTLQQAQAQLVQSAKMAALGNLVAGVAHEINTPVGTAIMMASTLESSTRAIATDVDNSALTQSKFESYLEVATEASHLILDNLNRAGDLVQSFKQVAVDQTSLKARRFNPYVYLQEVITSLSSQLRNTPHKVIIAGDQEIEVYSYPGAFSQIVTNLVINALMHAFPGDRQGEIQFTVSSEGDFWRLDYRDNGVGIAPEHREQIFEPFFTTARHKGGSGLGLHLVYNLVTQRLGGSITVSSNESQGTSFLIEIPHGLLAG